MRLVTVLALVLCSSVGLQASTVDARPGGGSARVSSERRARSIPPAGQRSLRFRGQDGSRRSGRRTKEGPAPGLLGRRSLPARTPEEAAREFVRTSTHHAADRLDPQRVAQLFHRYQDPVRVAQTFRRALARNLRRSGARPGTDPVATLHTVSRKNAARKRSQLTLPEPSRDPELTSLVGQISFAYEHRRRKSRIPAGSPLLNADLASELGIDAGHSRAFNKRVLGTSDNVFFRLRPYRISPGRLGDSEYGEHAVFMAPTFARAHAMVGYWGMEPMHLAAEVGVLAREGVADSAFAGRFLRDYAKYSPRDPAPKGRLGKDFKRATALRHRSLMTPADFEGLFKEVLLRKLAHLERHEPREFGRWRQALRAEGPLDRNVATEVFEAIGYRMYGVRNGELIPYGTSTTGPEVRVPGVVPSWAWTAATP